LRRGKAGLAVACGLGALAVNAACFHLYPEPPGVLWHSYRENAGFFRDYYFLENPLLSGSASPWNAYKIILISLRETGLLPSINFGFDGSFIKASYQVYMAAFALFSLLCVGYATFLERHFARSAIMLLLLITISLPSGPDYRLVFVSMALILTVLLRRRPGDRTVLLLLALAVIPKKEILLTYTGRSDAGDVPIQALINPIFILGAMAILLVEARHPVDWRKTALRLRDLLPWRWKWI
jgi:hypothetical protein